MCEMARYLVIVIYKFMLYEGVVHWLHQLNRTIPAHPGGAVANITGTLLVLRPLNKMAQNLFYLYTIQNY